MKYVKITNGIVEQVQPYPEDGFIEAPKHVVPGFLFDGSTFTAPTPPTPEAEPDPDAELDARIDAVDVSKITDPAIKQAFMDIKLALKGKARGRK